MDSYALAIIASLSANANLKRAAQQSAYLKNQFPFFGLTAGERRELQRSFLVKDRLPPKEALAGIVKEFWEQPQRECQYFAQELAFKYSKRVAVEDISLYEYMVTHKSWWDTVDFIAANLMGAYFKRFPE